MKERDTQYQDFIPLLFPEMFNAPENAPKDEAPRVKTFTFQVTEACSLCCTYCYQGNKSRAKMDWPTAKKAVDYLWEHRTDPDFYFSETTTKGLIVEFIGGEPLLEIGLVRRIVEYFEEKCLEHLDSPWAFFHRYSFSSNGVAYFEPEVQDFLREYGDLCSMSITVDGCKALHDQCRLFPDGTGSYDRAIKAACAELAKGFSGTKITLAPDNIGFVYEGVVNMLELGFSNIHINPAFEEGWRDENAGELYDQLKRVAQYIAANGIADQCYVALLDPAKYCSRRESEPDEWDKNWCGAVGSMLAVDHRGMIYPCIRFMASSLGEGVEPYTLGDLDGGIGATPEQRERIAALNALTKSAQSARECLDCPIESGCAWCTAYNYQHFGTIARRATYICKMHKAAALAAKYFAGLVRNWADYDQIAVDRSIAAEIISADEWNEIVKFEEAR